MIPLLEVSDLHVRFGDDAHGIRAVDGVSLTVGNGETLGLVGESGSGKSVAALALLRLLSRPGRIAGGSVRLRGRELLDLSDRDMRAVRGREIAVVFQDPMTSLNPVLTVGRQVTEMLEENQGLPPARARRRAVELLEQVGIPAAARRLGDYPHQFSGGMRQRVTIAIAVACRPRLLIADEPTTALDVTIQAQILDLLRGLQAELGMGLLLITHDLGVVAGAADRVAVMYGGRIVEEGPAPSVFAQPGMPYTAGLLAATPRLDQPGGRMVPIPGRPPVPAGPTHACRFAPRCAHVQAVCRAEAPALRTIGAGHRAACHFAAVAP